MPERSRRRAVVPEEVPVTQSTQSEEQRERFEVSDDALEVPSFLRE